MRYETGERKPDSDFIADICKAYNVNSDWLLSGEGPKHKGDRAAAYPEATLTLGENVELLAKIHNSGNTVLIKAITANLHAFSEAIDNKALALKAIDMMEGMNKRMLDMEKKLTRLEEENKQLKTGPPAEDLHQAAG